MSTTQRHKAFIPQGDVLRKSVQSKTWRKTFRRLLDKMPEDIRRWNAALLAMQLGYGDMKIAGEICCLSQPTLHKARQELENGQVDWASDDRWVNRTSRKLATAMGKLGHDISHLTVIQLLKKPD